MCGLVGVAGRLNTDAKRAFKKLLQLDTIRGPHSTGVLFVRTGLNKTEPDVEVLKKLGTPWDLFQYKSWDTNFNKENRVMLGHNRWATKGAINGNNAHPFEFNGLIGAHNGTLRNQALLDDHKLFDVDSENLYHHMNKHGLDETLMKTDGAFALSWWDREKGTLNFIRNKERPLYYVISEDGKQVFWASEKWMLQIALTGEGIKYRQVNEFEELAHYEMLVEECSNHVATQLPKFVRTKKEVYEPPVFQNAAGGNGTNGGVKTNPAALVGQVRTFYISQCSAPHSGDDVTYFGYIASDYGVKVRVHCKKGDFMDKLLSNFAVQGRYEGKVSGFRANNGGVEYVLLDKSSIVKKTYTAPSTTLAEDGGAGGTKKFFGYMGAPLTQAEWQQRTIKGCCWCGDPVPSSDADSIRWLAKDEILCKICKTDPQVALYLINEN